MILVIRIDGMVNVTAKLQDALFRMRLRRKYAAVVIEESDDNLKLLQKVRNHVAFGKIDDKLLGEIIEARGMAHSKAEKVDVSKAVAEIKSKPNSEWSIKPFFRLHPPRGGIDAKKHVGVNKGVLGDHKNDIGKLVRRML